jgi:hypothetical protein
MLAGSFVLGLNSLACLYFPPDYKTTISENLREFFLFHDKDNVHVIIQTHLKADGTLPAKMAWVVPFPSLPLRYSEADPKLFEELYNAIGSSQAAFGGISKGGLRSAPPEGAAPLVKVHSAQVVGNYKVHPLEILSDANSQATATVLDAWLKKMGFITIPYDLQKPYIAKGATFLAIEFMPQGNESDIKPLHIVFPKSDRFSIPLRMTHDTRVFDLRIYTFGFGKTWKDQDPFWSLHFGDSGTRVNYPQSNLEWNLQNKALNGVLNGLHGDFEYYERNHFNQEGQLRARQLPSDPTFQWVSTEWKPNI